MKLYNKILYLLTYLGLFFIFSFLSADKASAQTCTGGNWTVVYLCGGNAGTRWEINFYYKYADSRPDIHRYIVVDTPGALAGTCPSGTDYYEAVPIPSYTQTYKPMSGDRIRWLSACVDPEFAVTPTVSNYCKMGEGIFYTETVDVTCKTGYSEDNCIYGGCGSPSNEGYVDYNQKCPSSINQSDHCIYAGTIATCPVTHCRDYCSGCTLINKYCSSSSTSCLTGSSVPYSSSCGTQSTCSPPAPTVNAVASCSNNAGSISTTWSSVSYSDGVYDFRYKKSTDTTWIYDYDAPEPKVLNNLASNTTYNIGVRSHTTAGHHGPTNWGTDTVTTGDCDAPNLTFSAFTYPSGYAGDTGNASVTVVNNGATSTGVGFDVAVMRDGTSATCATDESAATSNPASVDKVATAALGAGASRTISIPVNLPTTAGNHTAVAMADADCNVTERDEADNDRTDAYTITSNNLTINVYQDLNGNGADDGGTEIGYAGANVIVTGTNIGSATSSNCTRQSSSSLSCTTNASGQIVITTILPGSTTANLTVPTNFVSTTTDPRTVSLPPSQTINFGIQPPAPTCSGGLTASPVTVNPGQVSTLTANGCTTPAQGATITYTWLTPAPGSITSTNPSTTPTSTWRAPTPYWTDTYSYPTVNVCQTGTTLCRPYAISNGLGVGNQGIHIVPLFTISGNVFVDQNKDSLQNGADANYSGGITITPNPAGVTVTYPSPGNYVINNMPGGQYTISYPSLPTGYQMTYPKNGPPPSFSVRVGNLSTGGACSVSGHNSAACDVNGNITALRYGITNSIPWIQSTGGDITGNEVTDPSGGGISNTIPPGASCGPYMSLTGSGGTPGVIYAGAGSYNFGSGQASPNPYNWVVGGLSYPDTYIPTTPGVIRTSYGYMRSLATQSGLTPVDISAYCGAGGISNCTLSTSIPNGLYISNGNLTLTGASYTFPANRNFVILVNGNLTINTEIHVPIGSTAFFTTSGDISVGSNVGEAIITSTRSNVEGYYSTDRSFYALGLNACPTVDRRLNVAGSIVVNASLTGGSFVNQRDLCAGDLQCPVFMVTERPDFVLNSPEFLKSARRVWREIAP